MKTTLGLMATITNNGINEQKESRCPRCDKISEYSVVIADCVDMTFAERECTPLANLISNRFYD